MLKFVSFDVVFQEIPDEVTLAVNLSHCPNRCAGCHSPHLWEDVGEELDETAVATLIEQYGAAVTCFCFMGGDREPGEVERLARFVHSFSSLKTAWYSGREKLPADLSAFEYVKLGAYRAECGDLRSPATNQRLYAIEPGGTLKELTGRFRR